jgi:hypothetical protein
MVYFLAVMTVAITVAKMEILTVVNLVDLKVVVTVDLLVAKLVE